MWANQRIRKLDFIVAGLLVLVAAAGCHSQDRKSPPRAQDQRVIWVISLRQNPNIEKFLSWAVEEEKKGKSWRDFKLVAENKAILRRVEFAKQLKEQIDEQTKYNNP